VGEYLRDVSVMIVDDQKFTADLLRQMVKVLGCAEVQAFPDANAAWDFFKRNSYDLILLDWEMSPGDGLKLTRLIRRDEESPNKYVPIIMVTAHNQRGHVFKARDAGVTEYVIKPVSPKALFSRIEAVIERPRRFVRVGDYFGPDRRRHKATYDGDERRGQDDKAKVPDGKSGPEVMNQDEINRTFNPDDDAPDKK
jgi:DNA-binding response OmpR family regulator